MINFIFFLQMGLFFHLMMTLVQGLLSFQTLEIQVMTKYLMRVILVALIMIMSFIVIHLRWFPMTHHFMRMRKKIQKLLNLYFRKNWEYSSLLACIQDAHNNIRLQLTSQQLKIHVIPKHSSLILHLNKQVILNYFVLDLFIVWS